MQIAYDALHEANPTIAAQADVLSARGETMAAKRRSELSDFLRVAESALFGVVGKEQEHV